MRYSDLDGDWESGLVPIVSEGLTSLLGMLTVIQTGRRGPENKTGWACHQVSTFSIPELQSKFSSTLQSHQ